MKIEKVHTCSIDGLVSQLSFVLGNNCLKKNRNPLNSKLVEWSSTKIELAEIQKTAFYEEHRLKLKHMQEKHDKWMLLQETESAMKMKFLKEEHDMNMSLLQEKKRLLDK